MKSLTNIISSFVLMILFGAFCSCSPEKSSVNISSNESESQLQDKPTGLNPEIVQLDGFFNYADSIFNSSNKRTLAAFKGSVITDFPERTGKFKGGAPIPKKGFETFAELREWATYTTTGWGWAESLQLGGKDVYYSIRNFTSSTGVLELVFYTKEYNGSIRPFLKIPGRPYREYQIAVIDNKIVVRSYNRKSKDWQVSMILTPNMLPAE